MNCIIILLIALPAFGQKDLLIEHAHYFDFTTESYKSNQYILIEDGNIKSITEQRPGFNTSDTKIINAKGKYIIPGLIDAHIHFFQSAGPYTRPDALDLREIRSYDEEIQWFRSLLPGVFKSYLKAGITSVIDIGGPMFNYQIRDMANDTILAPNVYITGPLISTYQPDAFKIEDPPIIKVFTPEEARELVRKQVPFSPDFIKIWYIVLAGEDPAAHTEIAKATIEESHKHGIKVFVHATDLDAAKTVVELGADVLVHSVSDQKVTSEFIDLLKNKNIVYIPTLVVSEGYALVQGQRYVPSEEDFRYAEPISFGTIFDLKHLNHLPQVNQRRVYLEKIDLENYPGRDILEENIRLLNEKGIKIATGTDAGNIGTIHGSSYYNEIRRMQRYNLSSLDILKACTIHAAAAIPHAKVGEIKSGFQADLLILNNDPLQDIAHLQNRDALIHRGKLIDEKILFQDSPEEIVQKQLNAYNSRNIDAFVACYTKDVMLLNAEGKVFSQGQETMYNNYKGFFESTPKLHCELVNRIVLGNIVIDQEMVTGLNSGEVLETIAIYTVADGLIQKVQFLQADKN